MSRIVSIVCPRHNALARSCPNHTADALQRFIEYRGNSALSVCPFCEHVSGAGMQASLVVALKRMWKDARAKEARFDTGADANERVLQSARFTTFARAWYRDQCGNEAVPLDLGL